MNDNENPALWPTCGKCGGLGNKSRIDILCTDVVIQSSDLCPLCNGKGFVTDADSNYWLEVRLGCHGKLGFHRSIEAAIVVAHFNSGAPGEFIRLLYDNDDDLRPKEADIVQVAGSFYVRTKSGRATFRWNIGNEDMLYVKCPCMFNNERVELHGHSKIEWKK